jgi:hypothetical protein
VEVLSRHFPGEIEDWIKARTNSIGTVDVPEKIYIGYSQEHKSETLLLYQFSRWGCGVLSWEFMSWIGVSVSIRHICHVLKKVCMKVAETFINTALSSLRHQKLCLIPCNRRDIDTLPDSSETDDVPKWHRTSYFHSHLPAMPLKISIKFHLSLI